MPALVHTGTSPTKLTNISVVMCSQYTVIPGRSCHLEYKGYAPVSSRDDVVHYVASEVSISVYKWGGQALYKTCLHRTEPRVA